MAVRAGTELGLAVDAAKELEKDGKKIRVVSLVSWELFEEQGKEYKASTLLHFCLVLCMPNITVCCWQQSCGRHGSLHNTAQQSMVIKCACH